MKAARRCGSGRPPVAVVAAVALALAVVSAGCTAEEAASGPDGPAEVVATFYPLAEAASRVGGDRVSVSDLTPAGVEPHDLELTPDQVDQLLDADLVVYLGGGFQPGVEEIVEQRKGPSIDIGSAAGAGSDAAGDDPHLWLDPTRQGEIAGAIEGALADLDPEGAAAFAAGQDNYQIDLDRLDQDFQAGLRTCARRQIVTTHAAFDWLARRYGLVQTAIAGASPEAEPDADRLAVLADQVRRDGVTTVFSEPLTSPDVAQALAREAGVGTAVLDPVEGLSSDDAAAGATYESVMRRNLAALRTALGCG
jgi:zinc transport system substrate-binding protein